MAEHWKTNGSLPDDYMIQYFTSQGVDMQPLLHRGAEAGATMEAGPVNGMRCVHLNNEEFVARQVAKIALKEELEEAARQVKMDKQEAKQKKVLEEEAKKEAKRKAGEARLEAKVQNFSEPLSSFLGFSERTVITHETLDFCSQSAQANAPKRARGAAVKTIVCANPSCGATCLSTDQNDWIGCDHCSLWFCNKSRCRNMLPKHELIHEQ